MVLFIIIQNENHFLLIILSFLNLFMTTFVLKLFVRYCFHHFLCSFVELIIHDFLSIFIFYFDYKAISLFKSSVNIMKVYLMKQTF